MNGQKDVLTCLTSLVRSLVAVSPSHAQSLFEFLLKELSLASTRPYAAIPWDDEELAIPVVVHALWAVAMDDSSFPVAEVKLLEHPSVRVASWATRVLTQSLTQKEMVSLIFAWALTLRSPSTRMKIVASKQLASFASLSVPEEMVLCLNVQDDDCETLVALQVDAVVENERIKQMAKRLVARSGTVSLQSVPSKYTLALAELSSLTMIV